LYNRRNITGEDIVIERCKRFVGSIELSTVIVMTTAASLQVAKVDQSLRVPGRAAENWIAMN